MFPLSAALQAFLSDTVVVVAARDGYDLMVAIASGALALAVLGVLAILLFTFERLRRASEIIEKARQSVLGDPSTASLRKVVGNLESISNIAVEEVRKLHSSVTLLSDRLTQASDRMEERIEEFNALMEVVQAEAEEVFVDTASTARGVRKGFSSLGNRRDGERAERASPPPAPPADFHPDDHLIE